MRGYVYFKKQNENIGITFVEFDLVVIQGREKKWKESPLGLFEHDNTS